MLNMGGMEIVVILVVALLILGPDKLPGLMRTVGKATKELRKASTEFQRTINTEMAEEEAAKPAVSDGTQQAPQTSQVLQASQAEPPAPAGTTAPVASAPETPVTQLAENAGKSKIRRSMPVPQQGRAAAKPLLRKRPASPSGADTGEA